MKRYAEISGWGKCIPEQVLSNQDLSTFLDTDDEWIRSRTGIKQRHVSHVDTSELASVAALHALACSGTEAAEVDLIILATCSPESIIPNTATFVQEKIGAIKAAAFDLNAACSGFLYGLNMATSMIQAGSIEKALIIGAERLTWYLDWDQRDSAVLFGDGAGAVVIEANQEERGVLAYAQSNNPKGKHCIQVHNFGTGMNKSKIDLGLQFEGRDVFKQAVPGMIEMSKLALSRAKKTLDEIDLIVPHQANIRIIEAIAAKLSTSMDKVFINIAKYGNTSAATIPIALNDAIEQKKILANQLILSPAFGAGLTSAASVIRWGERTSNLAKSNAKLTKCNQNALELIAKA